MKLLLNFKKSVSLILFSLVFISTAIAQEKVTRKGRVVDSQGNGIENVIINIENSATGSLSFDGGVFEIRTSENEVLVFRKAGFEVKRINVENKLDLGDIQLTENTDAGELVGTVKDASGNPLMGATILIVGTKEGTSTDFDGNFSLRALVGDEIEVSYVGFQSKRLKVLDKNKLVVTLQDSNVLDEVVVTALAIKREKKSLGYSISEVKDKELTQAKENNVAFALQGRVAGLQVSRTGSGAGSSSKIVLRGVSSLTGNTSPLIVIDGVPMDNSTPGPVGGGNNSSSTTNSSFDYGDGLGNINPDDVESISVLKGPNAAGLYGTRGANGVILITTKKGIAQKGIGVNFNTSYTVENPTVFPELQSIYGVGTNGDFPISDNGNGIPSAYRALSLNSWGPKLDSQQYINWNGEQKPFVSAGNIFEEFYKAGTTFANSLSIRGGGEKTTFYTSISNTNNEGIVAGSEFEQTNITLRASHEIFKNLVMDTKVSYIKRAAVNRVTGGASPFNTMNSLLGLSRDIQMSDLKNNYIDANGKPISPYVFNNENPYWIVNKFRNEDERDRIIGAISLNYEISDRFSASFRTGVDTYFDSRFVRIPKYSQSFPLGSLSFTEFSLTEQNTDFSVKYASDHLKDFSVTASIGGNILNRRTNTNITSGTQLKVPDLDNLTNASITASSIFESQRKTESIFGFAQFAYKNFAYLDLTGRNDWSSVLPEHNRSFFYPSATGTFIISSAFELPNKIDLLKIRGSWAQAGNDGSMLYQDRLYLDFLNETAANGGSLATFPNTLPNLDLKNELTSSSEFGLEFIGFHNRLGLDFTYYNAITKNQILISPISGTSGFSARIFNAGEIKNSGIEISLRGTPVVNSNFEWGVNVNFSQNRNEVVELDDDVDELVLNQLAATSVNKITIKAKPGQPFGNLYGKDFLRNERGEIIVNGQGLPLATDDEVLLGNSQPDWIGGITNDFKYKGLFLSALVEFSQGGDFYSETKARVQTAGTGIETVANRDMMLVEGVLANGAANTFPTTSEKYYEQLDVLNIASPFIEDASYISLREIVLGYELPSRLLKNSAIKSVKFSGFARNIAYLQRKAKHVAPEATLFSPRSNDVGIEFLPLPFTRNYGLKLDLEF